MTRVPVGVAGRGRWGQLLAEIIRGIAGYGLTACQPATGNRYKQPD